MNVVHVSGRASRRKRRADDILDTARALVAAEGLEALTLHRIARELGLVPAALYRYFASKDALLAELQRRTILSLHEQFRAARDQAAARAVEARLEARAAALAPLFGATQLYLDLPQRAREHFGLISVMLADPRPLVADDEAAKTAPALMAFLGDVRSLVAKAAEVGAISKGDSFDRTLLLWSSLQGVAQLGKISRFAPERFDVQRLGTSALSALLSGWGADARNVERAKAVVLEERERQPNKKVRRRSSSASH